MLFRSTIKAATLAYWSARKQRQPPPSSPPPPPYTIMPLPLGPSSGPLDGLYAAKDLSLEGRGKGSLGSLRLRFKRLYPLERAAT